MTSVRARINNSLVGREEDGTNMCRKSEICFVFYGLFGVEGDLMLLGTTEFWQKHIETCFSFFGWTAENTS